MPLEDLKIATEADSETLLLTEEALHRLTAIDEFMAEIVKLRFFVGLDNAELARVLEVSEVTVIRHWAYARTWLFNEIERLRNE